MIGTSGNALLQKKKASGFDPKTIAGLLVWLDAAHVTLSGSNVLTMPDQSGNGNDAVALGTSPTYTASNASYNNTPTVDFTALATTRLRLPDLGITTGEFTIVWVGQMSTADNSNPYAVTEAAGDFKLFTSAGNLNFGFNTANLPGGTSTVPLVMVAISSAANGKVYTSQKTTTSTGNTAGDLTGKQLVLGNNQNDIFAPYSQNGPLSQFLVYTGALSATDVGTLLVGFGAITGITIAP